MFKRNRKNMENQIPADLFVSIHSPQARRKRWFVEIVISLAIVIGLLIGGMALYKQVHRTNEPHSVPKSNAQRVMQPPTQSDSDEDSAEQPASTPGSDSTNDGSVPQPE